MYSDVSHCNSELLLGPDWSFMSALWSYPSLPEHSVLAFFHLFFSRDFLITLSPGQPTPHNIVWVGKQPGGDSRDLTHVCQTDASTCPSASFFTWLHIIITMDTPLNRASVKWEHPVHYREAKSTDTHTHTLTHTHTHTHTHVIPGERGL